MVQIKNNERSDQDEERIPIPDGAVFEAEVLTVKLEDSKFYKNEDGTPQQIMNFKFKVVNDGEHDGAFVDRWVWGSTPPWLNDDPRCKLRNWVEAILDIDLLPPDYLLETDDLQGMQCRVIVSAKESTTNPGRITNKVTELKNTRGKPVMTVAQSADDPLDEEPF